MGILPKEAGFSSVDKMKVGLTNDDTNEGSSINVPSKSEKISY